MIYEFEKRVSVIVIISCLIFKARYIYFAYFAVEIWNTTENSNYSIASVQRSIIKVDVNFLKQNIASLATGDSQTTSLAV